MTKPRYLSLVVKISRDKGKEKITFMSLSAKKCLIFTYWLRCCWRRAALIRYPKPEKHCSLRVDIISCNGTPRSFLPCYRSKFLCCTTVEPCLFEQGTKSYEQNNPDEHGQESWIDWLIFIASYSTNHTIPSTMGMLASRGFGFFC